MVEELSILKFVLGNLISLIAPQVTSGGIDSIKERVKAAGKNTRGTMKTIWMPIV